MSSFFFGTWIIFDKRDGFSFIFPSFCFLIQEKIPVSSFICNKDEKELVFFPLLYYNPLTQRNILPLKERWKKL